MIPENLIIVIGRQYGAGGRYVGRKLAERLNLDYYDKELLQKAAGELGFSTEVFSHADEKKPSFFHKIFLPSYGITGTYSPDPMSGEGIYRAQSNVISSIGEKGGCVIVGRTADHILRNHPHLISVFLHSPLPWRAKNIVKRGESDTEKKGIEIAYKKDKQREAYYNYFTGKKWGTASNYDITVDSSLISPDDLVDILATLIANKYNTKGEQK
ncbi:MAG: cytidylate kinase-like family protein [Muribaculaceae bacterium]|nr:cytidylate kinase-like family protein [Muribaculaceae bacterium]